MQQKSEVAAIAIVLGAAVSLIAGGFGLQIDKPSTNPEAQAKNAVLLVRGYGCAAPETTTVSAVAEGLVNGKRQTIPLMLAPLSGGSTYALTRQWPNHGRWVIILVAANPRFNGHPSAIVKVDGASVEWTAIAQFPQAPNKQDIEAALNTMSVASKL